MKASSLMAMNTVNIEKKTAGTSIQTTPQARAKPRYIRIKLKYMG